MTLFILLVNPVPILLAPEVKLLVTFVKLLFNPVPILFILLVTPVKLVFGFNHEPMFPKLFILVLTLFNPVLS